MQIQRIVGLTSACRTPLARITSDMRDMLVDVHEKLQSHQRLSPTIDPRFQQALYLEDSLGYLLRVPLETIGSWEVRHSPLF
jgi:hypothetical protein